MSSSKFPRKRKKGPTSVDFWRAPSHILRSMRARDAEINLIIASGDLAAIAARGRYLAAEIQEGTAAYPNLSAQLLENLRVAHTLYMNGTMPVEEN